MPTRRQILAGASAAASLASSQTGSKTERYVRFSKAGRTAYGLVEGDQVRELSASPFAGGKPGRAHALKDVQLEIPCEPRTVIAVARNYKSHIGSVAPPARVENFYKPVTSLERHEGSIVLPSDSTDVHYEGELVLVIGKRASKVSKANARDHIWGITCGNDVSERQWQGGPAKDIQWWRAKGADTFGPVGPWIVRGLDHGKLMLRTRLNGQVVQEQSTSELIYDCETILSFTSQFVTLNPGDLIYTGTPGTTKPMKHGDVVEVDIEGVGVLRNKVVKG